MLSLSRRSSVPLPGEWHTINLACNPALITLVPAISVISHFWRIRSLQLITMLSSSPSRLHCFVIGLSTFESPRRCLKAC
ncbi:hypothetical protein PLICRDRAFT_518418 [Plicaturopsis crispa FD-325 SS-3]|nr:hypothetical protein PLICRDRAFT_518418 [Plicaturopsis crispa FD-325 SS-3]